MKIDILVHRLNMIHAHMGNVETHVFVDSTDYHEGGLFVTENVYPSYHEGNRVVIE